MKDVALIFPGQGSQKVGMGLEFYRNSPAAKSIFEQAEEVFKRGQVPASQGPCSLLKVIFEGPEETLTSTAYCQPAILTMSVAALKAFQDNPKFKEINVRFTAGHSLGEYSALVAAGILDFAEALRLVQKRAGFMEEASRQSQGAMAAVIGFDKDKLVVICRQTGAEIANYNSLEQTVITGPKAKVEAAMDAIKAAGCPKVIPLVVSGGFHSSLMKPAAEKFALVLKEAKINSSQIPVLSNVSGQPHGQADQIRELLSRQVAESVQWVKCVEYMANQGITDFIEIGPGKVLKGLIRRINPALSVFNIEKPQDIEILAV